MEVREIFFGLFMACALGIVPALGQANNVGLGTTKCVDFLSHALLQKGREAASGWASGFVSGVDVATAIHTGQIYDVSNFSFPGTVSTMGAYCNAYSDQPVIASVDSMLAGLPQIASPF